MTKKTLLIFSLFLSNAVFVDSVAADYLASGRLAIANKLSHLSQACTADKLISAKKYLISTGQRYTKGCIDMGQSLYQDGLGVSLQKVRGFSVKKGTEILNKLSQTKAYQLISAHPKLSVAIAGGTLVVIAFAKCLKKDFDNYDKKPKRTLKQLQERFVQQYPLEQLCITG